MRGGGRQTDGEAENVALPSHKEKDDSSLDENGEISQVLADLAFHPELYRIKNIPPTEIL